MQIETHNNVCSAASFYLPESRVRSVHSVYLKQKLLCCNYLLDFFLIFYAMQLKHFKTQNSFKIFHKFSTFVDVIFVQKQFGRFSTGNSERDLSRASVTCR